MEFRTYREEDYEAVCDFLTELNRTDRSHINWCWARFEWMAEHPEFDKSLTGSIGLWLDKDRIVGAAIYDLYFGEAFCGALPEAEDLYPAILDYAWRELKDDAGLGIAACDRNEKEIAALKAAGFEPAEQTETVMTADLIKPYPVRLPEGLHLTEPDPVKDGAALQWLFWQGFNHGDDREEFERQNDPAPAKVRKHLKPQLGLAAADSAGNLVAFCCLWYKEDTDYAYVEPVCTVPAWRKKGVAKALLYEAMNRAAALGAKKAYVISDKVFYEKIGFKKEYHYTFYWKK